MRPIALLVPLLLAAAAAGCASDDASTGRFVLRVTDQPNAIGDFSSLNVTVSKIVLTGKENGTVEVEPSSNGTFDLTRLVSGNVTTLFNGSVAAGEYNRLDLFIASAEGVLQEDGSTVTVGAPSGRIFLNAQFTIAEGQETDFLFDVQVVQTGNGEYQLKPNAEGSGPGMGGAGAAGGAGKGGRPS